MTVSKRLICGVLIVLLCCALAIPAFGQTVVSTDSGRKSCVHTEEHEREYERNVPVKLVFYYDENDITAMAKLLYAECGGVKSTTEQACVAWIVCNWADVESEDHVGMISKSIKKKGRFAYRSNAPVTEKLYDLAADVLFRWNLEKNGYNVVGRVIPNDFFYFGGDGKHNYFRRNFKGDRNFWDYSLESPYDVSA